MRSRDRGLLRSLEHQLWLVAVGMLAVSAFVAAEGTIYQFYLNWKFDDALEAEQRLASTRGEMEPIALPNVSAPIPSAPIASLPPSAPTHAAPVVPPSYLGRLEIPRLDMSIMLLDGVDNRTLRRGIGHIPGTPFPGKRGNAGIAGHRDTFFRALKGIQRNDQILVQTLEGKYKYSVESIRVVDAESVDVLRDAGHPVLTLVTCYPFNVIGPAPRRFIVQASLVATTRPDRLK